MTYCALVFWLDAGFAIAGLLMFSVWLICR